MMMDELVSFAREALKVELTEGQLSVFERYAHELLEWNARTNLTSITGLDDVIRWHFIDSLTCLKAIGNPVTPCHIIDVGAGAGFPGVPLKLACPDIRLTLLEATGKKAEFLRHIVSALGLARVDVIAERAETWGQAGGRGAHDWSVARAVAPLRVLLEYLLPLVSVGGRCLAMKGRDAASEVQEAAGALAILGGRISDLVRVDLPGLDEPRYLVVIDKIAQTPSGYPRRPGIPAKRPL